MRIPALGRIGLTASLAVAAGRGGSLGSVERPTAPFLPGPRSGGSDSGAGDLGGARLTISLRE